MGVLISEMNYERWQAVYKGCPFYPRTKILLYGDQGDGGLDRVCCNVDTRDPLPSNDGAERKERKKKKKKKLEYSLQVYIFNTSNIQSISKFDEFNRYYYH